MTIFTIPSIIFVVCSAITSYSGDDMIINPKWQCEVVYSEKEVANMMKAIKSSSYSSDFMVYETQKVNFEYSESTKATVISIPQIKLNP